MKIIDNITNFFSFNTQGKLDLETQNKIVLIYLFCFLGVVYTFILGIFAFLLSDKIAGIILFSSSFISTGIILFIRKTLSYYRSSLLFTATFSLMTLLMLLCSNEAEELLLGGIIYPLFIFFVLDKSKGVTFSILMFVIWAIAFFIPPHIFQFVNFSVTLKIIALTIYLIVFFGVYLIVTLQKHTYNTMEKNILEAQKKFREKNEFISKLSHKIRTPLNNVLGVVDILTNETDVDAKQKDLINTIQASATNLVSVVNSIDKFSDLKIDVAKNNSLTFSLYLTIQNTLNLFSNNSNGNVKFNYNFNNTIPSKLLGNPVVIKQIFLNIIESYLKQKSDEVLLLNIVVRPLKQKDDEIEILFEIAGNRGIDSITDVDNEKDTMLSIDLDILENLISQSKGALKISSKENNTVMNFNMIFKVVKNTTVKNPEVSENHIVVPDKQNQPVIEKNENEVGLLLENSNVLLVEDNLINQKIMVLSLKKIVKNIEIANNGKEALDKFSSTKYHLILMDVQMPIMDGIKATQKIREIEYGTGVHTPIIAITANALAGDREECLNAGMDDYISKPFKLEVVLEKMKFFLAKYN